VTALLRQAPEAGIDLTAEVEQRLDAVTDLYDNDDAYARRVALAACRRGDAAYWTRASYHSQRACQLQITANQMLLRNALRSIYKPGSDWIAALDTLIPLNSQAAAALSAAYAEYGLWQDEAELLARCVRRERGRRA
jgi:hypothetical protein